MKKKKERSPETNVKRKEKKKKKEPNPESEKKRKEGKKKKNQAQKPT